jgi:hypothetical protein
MTAHSHQGQPDLPRGHSTAPLQLHTGRRSMRWSSALTVGLSVLCLCLAAVSCVLWWNAAAHEPYIIYRAGTNRFLPSHTTVSPECVGIVIERFVALDSPLSGPNGAAETEQWAEGLARQSFVERRFLGVATISGAAVFCSKMQGSWCIGYRYLIIVPYPHVVGILLLWPGVHLTRWFAKQRWITRRLRRYERGLCVHCAYDLRAHKPGEKCPECGTVIADCELGNAKCELGTKPRA